MDIALDWRRQRNTLQMQKWRERSGKNTDSVNWAEKGNQKRKNSPTIDGEVEELIINGTYDVINEKEMHGIDYTKNVEIHSHDEKNKNQEVHENENDENEEIHNENEENE
eukprot:5143903-Ditylum_brightwellii.AAC.1